MRSFATAFAVIALGVLICGETARAQQAHPVLMAGFQYVPGNDGVFGIGLGATPVTLVITQGDTLDAINLDPDALGAHTITSSTPGLFDSGDVAFGESKV
ncbi:MAG: cupredoxin domain-containing protein, partial [Candidatus Binatia bacterium]